MKTIIHDFDPAVFEELFPETAQLTRLGTSEPPAVILSPMYPARPCIGCFGCWIKTPGSCVLPDSYQEMGKLLSRTSELILLSLIHILSSASGKTLFVSYSCLTFL